jgi:hypothetical protein
MKLNGPWGKSVEMKKDESAKEEKLLDIRR